jgi:hypothetical protein
MVVDTIIILEFHIFLFQVSDIKVQATLQKQKGCTKPASRMLHVTVLRHRVQGSDSAGKRIKLVI